MDRQTVDAPGLRPNRRSPILRDPAMWLVAALVVFASGYTVWQAIGLGVPPLAAAPGGAATIPGAIVVGCFALQVRRRRILGEFDPRVGRLIVAACLLYWISAFATPTGSDDSTPWPLAAALLIGGLVIYPVIWWGLLSLSWVKLGWLGRVIFGLDLAIVAWAAAMVLWHLVLYPLGRDHGTSVAELAMVSTSPAADLTLVFLAIAISRGPIRGVSLTASRLLVLAIACVFAADLSLALVEIAPSPFLAMLPDLFRSWSWAVLATIWLALMRRRDGESDGTAEGILSFSWLPYVAIAVAFVVPAILSWGDLPMLEQHVPASGILIVLVLLRLAATARQSADLVASGAARRTEARFRALVQNASDLVALTDVDSRVRYLTPSAAKVLGLEPDALNDSPLTELLHPDDAAKGLALLAEVAATPGATRRAEWRLRRVDGSFCETEVLVSNMLDVPEIAGLVLTARDIGDRKALERQLTFQALHDPLTGFANRTLFADRVEHALVRSRRHGRTMAVICLDLDNFKRINDGHGHGAGDRLLVAVAARIAEVLRVGDTVARLGGDEFAVLLEDLADADEAQLVAEGVGEALRGPFDLGGVEAFVSASLGVALGRGTELDQEELLRNADVAMYVAKANGKGRSETFNPGMHQEVRDRLVLEADLRRAIDRNEFEVHYQPVWAIDTRHMVGVEALVRWRHPRRGLLTPGCFIATAEETGLIVAIGRLVLREACTQVVAWDRAGGPCAGLSVAVNLSPRQLREADLVETIAEALAESGLRAERLSLEITEAVLVDDSPEMDELLREIKMLGVRISIDDFGTGYSSLAYLRRLPIDTLKIPKPFIDVLTSGAGDVEIAWAIVSLARSLRLEVVAEGVEKESQLAILVEMGCELGQGYLVSPAVPADGLLAFASVAPGEKAA
jgi:diguanylate cyclase (GGDEF)-like protein/PAS domain S-box-containing protein